MTRFDAIEGFQWLSTAAAILIDDLNRLIRLLNICTYKIVTSIKHQ